MMRRLVGRRLDESGRAGEVLIPGRSRRRALGASLALALAAVGCGGSGEGDGAGANDPQVGSGGNDSTIGAGGTGTAGTAAGGSTTVETAYDVGFAPMTRLNRTQYNNTVSDLLGTALTPATRFPADNLALGFDTIGAVLNVSPEHVEGYLAASRDLIAELMARPASDPIAQRYLPCDVAAGAECQLQVLRGFAEAAWRRPVLDTELTAYQGLIATQTVPRDGVALALRAILTSPRFIYRMELDPVPDPPPPPAINATHTLSGYELASRLSYFLWSTMPDSDLLTAAAQGTLSDTTALLAQVDRMLADPTRSRQLIDNFGAQWLAVNRVLAVTPDPVMFPDFDEPLRLAMAEESKLFFGELLSSGQPLSTMFTADFKYVNARLAEHYGLPAVTGDTFQRVSTTGTARVGFLTQGAFLAGTSNPTRTSPVKRGLMVMDRILCAAPPPPPAGVDTNIDQGSGLENLSVRERLAQHQLKGDACASCHKVMDAVGLGLENYDAVGNYRTDDEFGPIDSSGALPSQEPGGGPVAFDGADALASILATDPRINACVVQQVMTYALGRKINPTDQAMKEAITNLMLQGGGSLRSAIEAVVTSEGFRNRRAALSTEVSL